MKKQLLFLILSLLIFGCSSIKKTMPKTNLISDKFRNILIKSNNKEFADFIKDNKEIYCSNFFDEIFYNEGKKCFPKEMHPPFDKYKILFISDCHAPSIQYIIAQSITFPSEIIVFDTDKAKNEFIKKENFDSSQLSDDQIKKYIFFFLRLENVMDTFIPLESFSDIQFHPDEEKEVLRRQKEKFSNLFKPAKIIRTDTGALVDVNGMIWGCTKKVLVKRIISVSHDLTFQYKDFEISKDIGSEKIGIIE